MKSMVAFLAAAALALSGTAATAGDYKPGGPAVARTQKPFDKGRQPFHFVVIGDRTGQHRPGVFEEALRQVDGLRPDFVINIGDLIEGNSEDRARLDAEWKEVTEATERLSVPFFYVPGNHDLTNSVQLDEWRKRLGADYYSFTYRDTLFLVLNTEDPPQPQLARKQLLDQYGPQAMGAVLQALQGDQAEAEALFARDPRLGELAARLRASEQVAISDGQIRMVREALRRNPKPRWTFVLMHRPAWKVDSPAFREIEAMLKGRDHMVLAGHFHRYDYRQRDGHDYIQLGVTGGMPGGKADDPAVVDHVMWVAMADGPPRITNIRLDGFFPRQGPAATAAPVSSSVPPPAMK